MESLRDWIVILTVILIFNHMHDFTEDFKILNLIQPIFCCGKIGGETYKRNVGFMRTLNLRTFRLLDSSLLLHFDVT